MDGIQILTIAAIALIIYNYLVYPVLVIVAARVMTLVLPDKHGSPEGFTECSVSFLIAAYNEERVIERKLVNTLSLKAPGGKLDIVVVCDGSDDGTADIARRFESRGVRVLHQPERRGKTAALNRGVAAARGEIIVFSDANNDFSEDAVLQLTRHFTDPKIGGVCGAKKIRKSEDRESAEGDSLYWKYESAIKTAESMLGSITAADGEIFAIRKKLYAPIDEKVINDDSEITLQMIEKGYRVIYENDAQSFEEASKNIVDDFNVKVRMVVGGFQTLSRYPVKTLVPFSLFSAMFFSHKVLRWLAPELMILAFIGSWVLVQNKIFLVLALLQTGVYLLAVIGWFWRNRGRLPVYVYLPFYICTMNAAALVALFRFVGGKSKGVWKKAER